MKFIKDLIFVIKTIVLVYKFIYDKIEYSKFQKEIRAIRLAIKKAKTGSLNDRLEGGQDVQDNFDRFTRK